MKLGLIGLKGHQSVVLSGMKQLGGWEVAGVAESDTKAAERFKASGAAGQERRLFEDWRRLLDTPPMDVCCVCDENAVRASSSSPLAGRQTTSVT